MFRLVPILRIWALILEIAINSMIRDIDALTASVYENKLEQERARSRQREAEFKMLASQINTLESIRMKARACGDTEVADMVKMLAKLMRHSIEVRDSLVPVRDELALTEYYLKLQHYRFGGAVQFTVTAESGCEQLFILPLLVQPLVENAFVHGLKERRMGGRITVHAEADDVALTITVTDNGVGMTPAALDALRQVGGIAAPGEVCDEGVCHGRSPPVVWMVSSLLGFGGAVQLGSKSDK